MMFLKKAACTLLLLPALVLTSCEQPAATTETPAATQAPAPAGADAVPAAATAAYVCPMGCEGSASEQPGQCPVCKMDLEPNPAAQPAATL